MMEVDDNSMGGLWEFTVDRVWEFYGVAGQCCGLFFATGPSHRSHRSRP